ncbi:MAG: demethoxyubiquinone hydroxylase family protein [Rhodospirillales bacterium]|nr:demethoxyubiquinone hydroxylase family protein [Rhodospirillales bacterium]MDH3790942.1 demethoxyubiquinone hydroxylase family protein [Rhodospirillales bacterium]MDH3912401.1 demethoxyubiquinone hydroxylase family protein [Rhodospirillales bacterium]MDH3918988.1 demethoxyubiquinone hydroxylase family protein [Rhodospirillales bacterium]MDH3969763.1 demethoxyubiquinone hydroxylase family protein [Rhodospirillales bacterium]
MSAKRDTEAETGPRHEPTGEPRLPGDPDREDLVARMIRVDQAGEYGARRIYEGQLAVLGDRPSGKVVRHMYEEELLHLETFDALVADRRVRPSLLQPFWHVAGFALGAATALMGERAAMACTVAVEEVIDEHYARQAEQLGPDEAALKETIEEFRATEAEHRDTGLEHEAEQAPGYPLLAGLIKAGSRTAIWLAERF